MGPIQTVRRAFSLLELVIAIAVIGIMLTVGIPRFTRRSALAERQRFVQGLNGLMTSAYVHAVETGIQHRVLYDFGQRTFVIEQRKQDGSYASLADMLLNGKQIVPAPYEFEQFIINKIDEMATPTARSTAWFYIGGNGVPQDVRITLITSAEGEEEERLWLVLNPFSTQFEAYDTKPA